MTGKDSYDMITEGELQVCPECGDYDGGDYRVWALEDEGHRDLACDASVCTICGRHFM